VAELVRPESSWNLPPTPPQIRAITRLCVQLKIGEPLEEFPSSRLEARRLIYDLRRQVDGKSS